MSSTSFLRKTTWTIHNSADVKDILHLHTIEARNLQLSGCKLEVVQPTGLNLLLSPTIPGISKVTFNWHEQKCNKTLIWRKESEQ